MFENPLSVIMSIESPYRKSIGTADLFSCVVIMFPLISSSTLGRALFELSTCSQPGLPFSKRDCGIPGERLHVMCWATPPHGLQVEDQRAKGCQDLTENHTHTTSFRIPDKPSWRNTTKTVVNSTPAQESGLLASGACSLRSPAIIHERWRCFMEQGRGGPCAQNGCFVEAFLSFKHRFLSGAGGAARFVMALTSYLELLNGSF